MSQIKLIVPELKNLTLTEKVLELFCFILKFSRVPDAVTSGSRKPTKSEVLSLVMTIIDPFAFLANIVIKCILHLYYSNCGCIISTGAHLFLIKYIANGMTSIRIPRCYGVIFTDPLAELEFS